MNDKHPIALLVSVDGEGTNENDHGQFGDDNRYEKCYDCGKMWPHDEVSLYNLAHVVKNMIKQDERPRWLCKSS